MSIKKLALSCIRWAKTASESETQVVYNASLYRYRGNKTGNEKIEGSGSGAYVGRSTTDQYLSCFRQRKSKSRRPRNYLIDSENEDGFIFFYTG